MSLLTSPKKTKNAASSSNPESKNWDKVFEAFFLSSLRCFLNSLSEGKEVRDNKKASVGIGRVVFKGLGFEREFFEDIHWRIWESCCVVEGKKFNYHLTLNSPAKCVRKWDEIIYEKIKSQ